MNWLAHLYLAEPTPAFRTGSILPDFVRLAEVTSLPLDLQRGIRLHHQIDAYTDTHPVVRASIRRIAPPFRRFGGILTDLWYDHFLARGWEQHSAMPLPLFVEQAYAALTECREFLPPQACERINQMMRDDWLSSYADLDGIRRALTRMSTRLKRPFDLAASMEILESQYAEFAGDFRAFFPDLVAFATSGRARTSED